jgi:hypothetical protein
MNDVSIETERFKYEDIRELLSICRGVNFGIESDIDVFSCSLKELSLSGATFLNKGKTLNIGDIVAVGNFAFKKGQEIFASLLVARKFVVRGKPIIKADGNNKLIYVGTKHSRVFDELANKFHGEEILPGISKFFGKEK